MEDLYKKYWKLLVYDAYKRLGDFSFAEDCAQETMICVYKQLKEGGQFESTEELKTFLYKTNANNALHIYRSIGKERAEVAGLCGDLSKLSRESVEGDFDHVEKSEELKDALSKIPFHHALATVWHYGYDYSYKNAGELLGCDKEAARKYASRGLSELKKIVKE